jgi:hypothetical protein
MMRRRILVSLRDVSALLSVFLRQPTIILTESVLKLSVRRRAGPVRRGWRSRCAVSWPMR